MTDTLVIPVGYREILDSRETERAILKIKERFQTSLAYELNLVRVTAPLFVESGTGINDDLNGVERPVSFPVRHLSEGRAEIVQSLAKWKRLTLADLGFESGEGLYADMNAIRPDENLDNTHSLYVDQWDWELCIRPEERTPAFLERVVRKIYDVIRRTERFICHEYRELEHCLPDEITFIHSQELLDRYPKLTPKERELEVCREFGAVFVTGIGAPLSDGKPHDGRAPDYDDWISRTVDGTQGLNGDILVYNRILDASFELSSMGIRVDPQSLKQQLTAAGAGEREKLYFHRRLLAGELPLSIGGGIGQSRLCMLYLHKAHIGEIQSGLWPEDHIRRCSEAGIHLL
jgi:aspartate--ammonia ligase